MKCLNTFHHFETMLNGNFLKISYTQSLVRLSGEFLSRTRQAFFKQEELNPKFNLISYNHQTLTVS